MKRLKLSLSVLLIAALSFTSAFAQAPAQQPAPAAVSLNPGVSPTYVQPSVEQLAQQLAKSMQVQAANQNTSAVAFYNQAVAQYAAFYGTKPNASAPAPPAPPLLTIVDTGAVIQDEIQWSQLVSTGQFVAADKINWAAVYTQIPYVPVGPPPAIVAPPVVVIGDAIPGEPGFFSSVSGDSPSIPAGFTQSQGGHQYKKFVFGPFGSVMWQQVS